MALTFKQRIIGGFVTLGVLPVAIYGGIIAYLNYQSGMDEAEHKMQVVRETVAQQVNSYFGIIHAQARTMAASPMVHDALRDFKAAVDEFDPASVQVDMGKYRGRYEYQQSKTPGSSPADVDKWTPTDPKTVALQYLYIANNPNEIGSKQLMDAAKDESLYSKLHAKYHPGFRDFVDEFGYYDMFIVDAETGYVVYTDFKEIDFMSNVKTGPLAETGFSRLAREILNSSDAEGSTMSDFEGYMPSYNDWAAFIGTPIVENGKTVGALLMQMPVGKMNEMFHDIGSMSKTSDGFIVAVDGRYRTKPNKGDLNIGDEVSDGLKAAISDIFATNKDRSLEWTLPDGNIAVGSLGHLEVNSVGGNVDAKNEKAKVLPWAVVVRENRDEILIGVWEQIWVGLGMLAAFAAVSVVIGMWAGNVLVKPVVRLAQNFGTSAEKVARATSQVGEAVSSMVAASEETSTQSVVIKKNSTEAAGYVANVSTAIEELNVSINDISQSIGETNVLIDDAVQKAQKTDEVVRNLGEAGKRISDVVRLINDLAEQTNLLALNAAIEAARAGDAGRGFAVVADEVKKLATHTSSATVEIGEQVRSIQDVSDQSIIALQAVVEAIHRIRDNATTVSAAVEEQSGVAKTIAGSVRDAAQRVQAVDSNMVGIEQAASDTGIAADQVNGSSQEVSSAFGELKGQVQGVLDEMGVK